MIRLEDNLYMHPNKNILEMRGFSREKLLSQEIEFSYCQKLSRLFKDDFDAYVFICKHSN